MDAARWDQSRQPDPVTITTVIYFSCAASEPETVESRLSVLSRAGFFRVADRANGFGGNAPGSTNLQCCETHSPLPRRTAV